MGKWMQTATAKVLGIGVLALLMAIPLMQVSSLVAERQAMRTEAVNQIADRQRWPLGERRDGRGFRKLHDHGQVRYQVSPNREAVRLRRGSHPRRSHAHAEALKSCGPHNLAGLHGREGPDDDEQGSELGVRKEALRGQMVDDREGRVTPLIGIVDEHDPLAREGEVRERGLRASIRRAYRQLLRKGDLAREILDQAGPTCP